MPGGTTSPSPSPAAGLADSGAALAAPLLAATGPAALPSNTGMAVGAVPAVDDAGAGDPVLDPGRGLAVARRAAAHRDARGEAAPVPAPAPALAAADPASPPLPSAGRAGGGTCRGELGAGMDSTDRGLAPSRRDEGDFSMLMMRCLRAWVRMASPTEDTLRVGTGRPARPLATAGRSAGASPSAGPASEGGELGAGLPRAPRPTPAPGGGGGGGVGLPPSKPRTRIALATGRLSGLATTVEGAREVNPDSMRLEL